MVEYQAKNWSRLETFDMRNNGLTAISAETLSSWPHLKQLAVSNNKLTTLPDSVRSGVHCPVVLLILTFPQYLVVDADGARDA